MKTDILNSFTPTNRRLRLYRRQIPGTNKFLLTIRGGTVIWDNFEGNEIDAATARFRDIEKNGLCLTSGEIL